ncbi:MAG: helix-turn-helix domain-containing protein [Pseudomonadota bacterium]
MSILGLTDADTQQLDSGIRMTLDGSLDSLTACDLLILPAIWRHPRRVLARMKPWLPLLQRLSNAGTRICTVGSSSSVLAEAGLLDGRPATTHWHDFERFARQYPAVQLKRRHLITQSDKLYCVGSVNSIADFMIHLLEDWYDQGVARAVEAQFSPEARQSFETAAFLQESPGAHHDGLVRLIQDTLQSEFASPHTLDSLAAQVGLSPRSLSRRFQAATGTSPMQHLLQLRIKEARALLQHSDLPVADVSWRCGFSSPSHFTQSFRRATGMPPRDFRGAVRGKRFVETAMPA